MLLSMDKSLRKEVQSEPGFRLCFCDAGALLSVVMRLMYDELDQEKVRLKESLQNWKPSLERTSQSKRE